MLWVLALIVAIGCFAELSYAVRYWSVGADCTERFYDYQCDYYNFTSDANAHRYLSMFEALTAFSLLMLLSHFVLFVLACVEVDRRRKYGKKSKVVYLVASAPPGDGRLYYSQVPPPIPETTVVPNPGLHGYFAPPAAAAAAAPASSAK